MKKLHYLLILGLFTTLSSYAQPTIVNHDHKLTYYCPPCNLQCDEKVFEKPGQCDFCKMELVQQTKEERAIQMKNRKKKIAFYLQDGVEILDFAGPMEVFDYAGFEIFTVSKNKKPIKSQGILKIIPDYSIDNAPEAEIMAFFGGNAQNAWKEKSVINWITSRIDKTEYFFSVCTGAFILGKSGILEGQTATTYHLSIQSLQEMLPNTKVLADVRYVDNGKVITTAGISAGIDGALHLVEKLQGSGEATRVAKLMEYDKWHSGEGLIVNQDK